CQLHPKHIANAAVRDLPADVPIFADHADGHLRCLRRRHRHDDVFPGRLSDQIGRRPVVLISLGIAAAGAVIFICAQNIWWLFPARIFSGLGIALVSGAPRRGWWSWSRKTTTPPRLKWQSVQIFSGLAWDHFLPVCSANTR